LLQWATRYNGTGNLIDTGRVIRVATSGNVYVGGRTFNGNNYDYIVLKYNSIGIQQWVNIYNSGGNDEGFFMEIDAAENVYITGNSDNATLTNTDIVTLKINSVGVTQWIKRYDGTAGGNDLADAIKLDSLGNIIIAGSVDTDTQSATVNNNIAIFKYDTNGNLLWTSTHNGTTNGDDQAFDIAIDSSNNIYLTGMVNGPSNYDYATIKFNSTGSISNVLNYNGTNNSDDIPQCILFKNNFVYVTGSSFGINSQADFTTLKYDSLTLGINNPISNSVNIKVYPNPTKNYITIDTTEMFPNSIDNLNVILSDISGRVVYSSSILPASVTELSIPNLTIGTYILQLMNGELKIDSKKIIIN
jgi:hypothetical protein